jgi:hypothetical protein
MRPAYSGLGPGRPNPVVLGRKFCPICGRWRPVGDFNFDSANKTGLRSNCGTCCGRRRRAIYRKLTFEQLEDRREYQRFWTDAKRREQGIPVRDFRNRRSVVDTPERILLPREPIVAELRIRKGQMKQLAVKAQVPERSITRLVSGESERVRIDVADKLAVAMGVPLEVIYREHRL